MSDNESNESRETVADEIKICPLCGGRVFWFPISNYLGCENCKNTFNRYTVFPDEVKKTSAVGNAAAMRDIVTALANVVLPSRGKADEDGWLAWVRAMQAKARAALADATTEKSSAVGNAAAMREALLFVKQYFDTIDPFNPNTYTFAQIEVDHIQDAISAALAAPPRNCNVGTPEEQGERCLAQFEQWRRNGDGKKLITAIMTWAQMPYTAEEGGAK